ncbi:MAG TPA: PadR family transcriptional regulator [Vicinamibacterales bacterium]|nr:PadR family transcriptional regulator [Vicinamibacterales bacterium]
MFRQHDSGRVRVLRGQLNQIVLEIIKDKPRHGYDVIKGIEEKFHGLYAPSAGSVYPILQALEDQGFVTSSQEGGKKIYSITADGKKELKENKDKLSEMREHLRRHVNDLGGYRDLMGEMGQTMQFVSGKLREKGAPTPQMVRKLRLAMVDFKGAVEEILRDQKRK